MKLTPPIHFDGGTAISTGKPLVRANARRNRETRGDGLNPHTSVYTLSQAENHNGIKAQVDLSPELITQNANTKLTFQSRISLFGIVSLVLIFRTLQIVD